MKHNNTLTQDELKALVSYDADTGIFTWRVKRGPARPGMTCSYKNSSKPGHERIKIRINNKLYAAHRLAWLYVYGHWPEGPLDHINRNPTDNRIENLRLVTHAQNGANSAHPKGSNTYRGVYFFRNGWMAQISYKGKSHYIGRFKTEEEAKAAWDKTARKLRGEFAIFD